MSLDRILPSIVKLTVTYSDSVLRRFSKYIYLAFINHPLKTPRATTCEIKLRRESEGILLRHASRSHDKTLPSTTRDRFFGWNGLPRFPASTTIRSIGCMTLR